jgi:predicted DCC family thiol-disulfide oxidoreductase YuxK
MNMAKEWFPRFQMGRKTVKRLRKRPWKFNDVFGRLPRRFANRAYRWIPALGRRWTNTKFTPMDAGGKVKRIASGVGVQAGQHEVDAEVGEDDGEEADE